MSLFPEGNVPLGSDSLWKLVQKIAGSFQSIIAGTTPITITSTAVDAASPLLYRQPAQNSTKATIQTGPTSIRGFNFINPNTYPVYVKFYNALIANVTVGTTVPITTLAVPAQGSWSQASAQGTSQQDFATGLVIAVTKNLADSDTTALATAILAEVSYK